MNGFRELLERMDKIPEGERRLLERVAWDPVLDCGCIFGTLYLQPRRGKIYQAFNFAGRYGQSGDVGFTAWAKALGLTGEDVRLIQTINDAVVGSPQQRWARVHARLKEWADGRDAQATQEPP